MDKDPQKRTRLGPLGLALTSALSGGAMVEAARADGVVPGAEAAPSRRVESSSSTYSPVEGLRRTYGGVIKSVTETNVVQYERRMVDGEERVVDSGRTREALRVIVELSNGTHTEYLSYDRSRNFFPGQAVGVSGIDYGDGIVWVEELRDLIS